MRTQLAKIALAAVFAALLSCDDAANNTSALAEHWRQVSSGGNMEHMELFKDGTGVIELELDEYNRPKRSSEVSVSWKVENGRFIIQSPSFAMTSDYKISGYKLTLIFNDRDSIIYVDEAHYAAFEAFEAIMEEAAKTEPDGKRIEVFGKAAGYSDKAIAATFKINKADSAGEAKAKEAYKAAKAAGASDEAANEAANEAAIAAGGKIAKIAKAYKAAKASGASDKAANEATMEAAMEADKAECKAVTAKPVDKGAAAFKAAKIGGASYKAAFEAAKVAIKAANNKEPMVPSRLCEYYFRREI